MHNNLRIKKYNKLVNEIIYFDEDKITNITKKINLIIIYIGVTPELYLY